MLLNRMTSRKHAAMLGTLAAVLVIFAGCATQSWVIDTVREMDKDLVARVAATETAAAAEKARVDSRFEQVAGQVGEVRTAASDARSRADQAASIGKAADEKAGAVDSRVSRILANRLKRVEVQQLDVTFETGKWHLTSSDRDALNDILKILAENPTYTADVIGYTDTVGKRDSNVGLSWRRSESVRRFLVERGAELHRFSFIGVGEELAGDDVKDAAKRAKNRRVSIVVFKPTE